MNPVQLSDFIKSGQLLSEALTHRSYCNEHPGQVHNERLEFLGDSVLSIVTSDRLFRLLPQAPEGELTARRSNLVQTTTLAEKARELQLNTLIKLSRGEEDSGGRQNTSLLADTFEAVLGAIFLDQGITVCYQFLELVFPDAEILSDKIIAKDPKSWLQELAQAAGWGTPSYETVSATGPDHAKNFIISVTVNGHPSAQGQGLSKQKAETQAAQNCLDQLFPDRSVC